MRGHYKCGNTSLASFLLLLDGNKIEILKAVLLAVKQFFYHLMLFNYKLINE